jgi:hypothetical protein
MVVLLPPCDIDTYAPARVGRPRRVRGAADSLVREPKEVPNPAITEPALASRAGAYAAPSGGARDSLGVGPRVLNRLSENGREVD